MSSCSQKCTLVNCDPDFTQQLAANRVAQHLHGRRRWGYKCHLRPPAADGMGVTRRNLAEADRHMHCTQQLHQGLNTLITFCDKSLSASGNSLHQGDAEAPSPGIQAILIHNDLMTGRRFLQSDDPTHPSDAAELAPGVEIAPDPIEVVGPLPGRRPVPPVAKTTQNSQRGPTRAADSCPASPWDATHHIPQCTDPKMRRTAAGHVPCLAATHRPLPVRRVAIGSLIRKP